MRINYREDEMTNFWNRVACMKKEEVARLASHIEVLDKVKALMTLPGFDVLTTRQVAEYYEANLDTVRRVYQRHKAEIDSDGTAEMKPKDFLTEPQVHLEAGSQGVTTIVFDGGVTIGLSNRGTRVFSRRAVLRMGMFMPSSRVATEVRTQLLNAFEKVPTAAVASDIDEEVRLRKLSAEAFAAGRYTESVGYIAQLTEYLDRHNKALREANKNLADDNERLDAENKVLLKEEMEWDTRKLINAVVRRIAGVRFPDGGEWKYGKMWNYWKSLMYNKEGISIGRRQVGCKGSYLDMLRDDEWPAAMSCTLTFAKQYGVDIADLLAHAKEGLLDECKS